ncbi:hypothetical protein JMJ58_19225 [Haloterrigena salifodinae]|uniref:Tail fiber protein n=1 Tax=Haloterrigena salifodinae TaxID=2675099 RepID=A0A8T8DZR2_9EURY|nr:hypothetical protein [Haloterrigena salifodinae]QRV15015.1 hypothetical protein JMJ58_19225 [Haloterrigena salifodinae]
MTSINVNGVKISPQDLSLIVPTEVDHGRLFNHDGTSAITLHDGTETTVAGIYVWDNDNRTWRGLKTNADVLDGKHASDFALDEDLVTHIGDSNNPHGLSVEDIGAIPDQTGVIFKNHLHFDPATQDELDTHIGDSDNPHGITASGVGAIEDAANTVDENHLSFDPATQSELDAHEDASNPHTGSASQTDLTNHTGDTSNPHGVTHSQLSGVGSSDHHEKTRVEMGRFTISATGNISVNVGFRPTRVEFHGSTITGDNVDRAGPLNGNGADNYSGHFHGYAKDDGTEHVVHSGLSGNSVNATSHYSSTSRCVAIRWANQDGGKLGMTDATMNSWDADGFTVNVTSAFRNVVVHYTAYRD